MKKIEVSKSQSLWFHVPTNMFIRVDGKGVATTSVATKVFNKAGALETSARVFYCAVLNEVIDGKPNTRTLAVKFFNQEKHNLFKREA